MQFGVFDQNDDTGRDHVTQFKERMALVELYEQVGFHRYQMSEHHGTPLSIAPSPSVLLAAVSQRTKTLRLGSLVYLLPAYNPLRLTEEICMLDNLSDGRFEFGVGRGASSHEMEYMGVVPEHAAPMYAEAFQIVSQGLKTGKIDHKGDYWSYDDIHLSVRPVQHPHPKAWYAVASADSAVWPAQNGVNIICGGPPDSVGAITARYRGVLAEQTAEIRQAGGLTGISRHIFVANTDHEAIEIAKRAYDRFYGSFIKLWKRYGTEPKNLKLPPSLDPLLETGMALVGSPSTVRAKLAEQVRNGGINYFSGIYAFGDLSFDEVEHSVRLFATEVMPEVAATWESIKDDLSAAA